MEPGAGQRRMIHTRLRCEDEQRTFDFARKDTIIYTNLGLGGPINRRLEKAGKESLLETPSLAELHHGRVHVVPRPRITDQNHANDGGAQRLVQ